MKSILVIIALLAVLAIVPFALAESNETTTHNVSTTNETNETTESPGITPDHPFWGVKIALERIQFNLARDKANFGLKLAELRLLEIQAMAKKGKLAAAEKSEAERERIMEKLNATITKLKGANNETLKGIEQGMQNHLEALAKVRAKIEANVNMPAETKEKLLAKIDNMTDKSNALLTKIEAKKTEITSSIQGGTQNKSCSTNETNESEEADGGEDEENEEIETCTSCGCGKK
jgi:chromosome segregation ATPase